MISIDDLTVGQARELAKLFGQLEQFKTSTESGSGSGGTDFWQIGQPYLLRTVTMIDTGVLVAVTEHEIILRDAAWIADTGRFAQALESCDFGEVEPFPDGLVAVGRGALIEAVRIKKAPREVK